MTSDLVIGTGKLHSVRELCEKSSSYAGLDYRDHVVINEKSVTESKMTPFHASWWKNRRRLSGFLSRRRSQGVAELAEKSRRMDAGFGDF